MAISSRVLLSLLAAITLFAQDAVGPHINAERKARTEKRYTEAESEAAAAIEEAEKLGLVNPKLPDALFESCITFNMQRKYKEAEPVCHRGYELSQAAALGPATVVNGGQIYGRILLSNGKPSEAVTVLKSVLETNRKTRGADHISNAGILYDLGWAQERAARHAESEATFRSALLLQDKSIGPDRLATALTMSSLAQVLSIDSKYAEAAPLYQSAIRIREAVSGLEDPAIAEVLVYYGDSERRRGHNAEAEALLRRALTLAEKSAPRSLLVSTIENNLAMALQNLKRYDEAEKLLLHSLDLAEAAQGSETGTVVRRLGNLAQVYRAQGRLPEAEQVAKRALAVGEKSLGADNPALYSELYSLGDVYRDEKRFADAEAVYRRLLAIQQKYYGAEHPESARVMRIVARTLQDQNRLADAEALYRRALEITARLDPKNTANGDSLNALGSFYRAQARYLEAEPLLRQSLEISQATAAGTSGLSTINNNYAVVLREMGRIKEAVTVQEMGVRAANPNEAPANKSTAAGNLAELYRLQGRYAEAEPLFQESTETVDGSKTSAVRLRRLALLDYSRGSQARAVQEFEQALAVLPKNSEDLHASILQDIGNAKRALGAFPEAGKYYREALAERESQPVETPLLASLMNDMATLALRENHAMDAEPLLARARRILERTVGHDSAFTAACLENQAMLDRARGKLAASQTLLQQALAIYEKTLGEVPALAPTLREYARALRLSKQETEAARMDARAAALSKK